MKPESDEMLQFKRELTHFGMEPFTTDADAFRKHLQSLGIVGLRIMAIKLTGMNTVYSTPFLCRSLAEYKALSEEWKPVIRRCFAETDSPLLIRLENDRILSLYSSDDDEFGEVYYASLDALPWDDPMDDWRNKRINAWDPPNCNANVLFGRAIGMKIDGFKMITQFDDDEKLRMDAYALTLVSPDPPLNRLELSFEDNLGYSWIDLKDRGDSVLELSETQIPALFAGFEDWKDDF